MDGNPLPINISGLTASHSALTAVMSGFALAGLFLLMDRRPADSTAQEKEYYNRSVLFLFLAFIIGCLCSFLYSSLGAALDAEVQFYMFQFPSALFAITAALLLSGISLMFSVLRLYSIEATSRFITYLVVLFSILTIIQDLQYNAYYFELHRLSNLAIWIVALIPILCAVIILSIHHAHMWVLENTFGPFAIATIAGCLSLAALNQTLNYRLDPSVEPKLFILLLTMGSLSILSSWSVLMIPRR